MNQGMNIAADGISFRKHSLQDTTPRRKDLRGYSIQLSAYAVPQLTAYRYDQLNRIKQMKAYRDVDLANNTWGTGAGYDMSYEERYTYDANGNILTLKRNGLASQNVNMDDLAYSYFSNGTQKTNKLIGVGDNASYTGNYAVDIDDQGVATSSVTATWNYDYDEIGNLTKDVQEEIEKIDWTVYGKVKSITRIVTSLKPDLIFSYDASGNRIVKLIKPRTGSGIAQESLWTYTYYVRDAQGNVLATYDRAYLDLITTINDVFSLKEHHLFGSSRLGLAKYDDYPLVNASFTISGYNGDGTFNNVAGYSPNDVTAPIGPLYARELGNKLYECSNHLGNVLVVVSDRKLPVDINADNIVDYYTADVVSATDYYAFGMQMPGRQFNSPSYRYGFNGKEKTDEWNGNSGASYDYGFRIYDPRLSRFLSVDPLTRTYPMLTPYQYASNSPILFIDIDGLEGTVNRIYFTAKLTTGKLGFSAKAFGLPLQVQYATGAVEQEFKFYFEFNTGGNLDIGFKHTLRNIKEGGKVISGPFSGSSQIVKEQTTDISTRKDAGFVQTTDADFKEVNEGSILDISTDGNKIKLKAFGAEVNFGFAGAGFGIGKEEDINTPSTAAASAPAPPPPSTPFVVDKSILDMLPNTGVGKALNKQSAGSTSVPSSTSTNSGSSGSDQPLQGSGGFEYNWR